MKLLTSLSLVLLSVFSVSAQTASLVVFSDDGTPFTAFINGEQVNASPATNVRKTDIIGEGVRVRIVFDGKPELNKNVMVTAGEERTLSIIKNKKGEYAFRLISSAPTPVGNNNVSAPAPVAPQPPMATTTLTTTTVNTEAASTITMNGSPGPGNVTISINANMPQQGVMTSTTTTTASNVNSMQEPATESTPATRDWESCTLHSYEYDDALKSIQSKPFTEGKMTVAKQILKNNCVTSAQVKGMAQLFDYEEDKLTFVKYAYNSTSDKKNYFVVNDIFKFDASVQDLNKYLDTQH